MSYIMKDRNGTYYLRIVLSEHVRQKLGQRELRRSLGTKSKREAYKRLPAMYMDAMKVIEGTRELSKDIQKPSKPAPTKDLLSVLLKRYAEHQKLSGLLPASINKYQYAVSLVIEIVGDKSIVSYTKDDVRKFREEALKIPKKGHQGETISITTYNNYITRIMSFFIWCEKEGYVDTNIFKGSKIIQKRHQSSYRNKFTLEDLERIFSAIENTPDIRADRYWIPYISYYTGCRVNEVCMLSKDDIYKVEGVWCIHFREGKSYQRLKNQHSERIIPIHSSLVEMGFIDYVESVEEDRIFPMLKITKGGSFSAPMSDWFGKLVRKLEIGPNKTFHSFRHTVSNICKQNGIDVSLAASLLGHSTNTISYDRYGKSLNPLVLVDVVEIIPPIKVFNKHWVYLI